jgi:hypothetical protein
LSSLWIFDRHWASFSAISGCALAAAMTSGAAQGLAVTSGVTNPQILSGSVRFAAMTFEASLTVWAAAGSGLGHPQSVESVLAAVCVSLAGGAGDGASLGGSVGDGVSACGAGGCGGAGASVAVCA